MSPTADVTCPSHSLPVSARHRWATLRDRRAPVSAPHRSELSDEAPLSRRAARGTSAAPPAPLPLPAAGTLQPAPGQPAPAAAPPRPVPQQPSPVAPLTSRPEPSPCRGRRRAAGGGATAGRRPRGPGGWPGAARATWPVTPGPPMAALGDANVTASPDRPTAARAAREAGLGGTGGNGVGRKPTATPLAGGVGQ